MEYKKYSKEELVSLCEVYKSKIDYLVPSSSDPDPTIEDCRNVINEDVAKYNTSNLVEINNAYIEDTEIDGYDVSGRVSKLWIHKDEYKNLDKYKIS